MTDTKPATSEKIVDVSKMTAISGMTSYDIDILRELNGEKVEGVVYGAAMMTCVSFLRNHGLVSGLTDVKITDKGREALKAWGY